MAIGNTSVWRIHGVERHHHRLAPPNTTRPGSACSTAPGHGAARCVRAWNSTPRCAATLGVFYYRVSYKRPSRAGHGMAPEHRGHQPPLHARTGRRPDPRAISARTEARSAPRRTCIEIPPGLPPVGQWSIPNAVLDTQDARSSRRSAVAPGVAFDDNGTPLGTATRAACGRSRWSSSTAPAALVDPEALQHQAGASRKAPTSPAPSPLATRRRWGWSTRRSNCDGDHSAGSTTIRPTPASTPRSVGGSTAADHVRRDELQRALAAPVTVPFLRAADRPLCALRLLSCSAARSRRPEYRVISTATAATTRATMSGNDTAAPPPTDPAAERSASLA
jgi:hypothetical protein